MNEAQKISFSGRKLQYYDSVFNPCNKRLIKSRFKTRFQNFFKNTGLKDPLPTASPILLASWNQFVKLYAANGMLRDSRAIWRVSLKIL